MSPTEKFLESYGFSEEEAKEAVCRECDGYATVDWSYRTRGRTEYFRSYECPVCKGSGMNASSPHIHNYLKRLKDENNSGI